MLDLAQKCGNGSIYSTSVSREKKIFLSQKFLHVSEENSGLAKPSDLPKGHLANER